jgi:hypothetical protein
MNSIKKLAAIKNVIFTFLFSISCLYSSAQENKNRFILSTGVSVPFIKDSDNDYVGGNGSNFSLTYAREIIKVNRGFYTLDAKFLSITNTCLTDDATKDLNSDLELTSVTGSFTGSSDKFKLSSYLLGVSFNKFLSKNNKLIGYSKIYLGSATLINPSQTFNSKNGFVFKSSEVKSSGFIYSTEAGLYYDISKSVSIGTGVVYTKSSFKIDNQKATLNFSGNSASENIPSYTLDYANFNLNVELIFKF